MALTSARRSTREDVEQLKVTYVCICACMRMHVVDERTPSSAGAGVWLWGSDLRAQVYGRRIGRGVG